MLRSHAPKVLLVIVSIALAGCLGRRDIVESAAADDQFETFVTVTKASGLSETLKGDGPFTVFAPTDAAFAKLPEGTVERLLQPENKDELVAILSYHVVRGKIAAEAIAGQKARVSTIQGGKLSVDATDGMTINKAKVIAADVKASNGIIYPIDTVVLPK